MLKQRATILLEVITGAFLFTVLHTPFAYAFTHAENDGSTPDTQTVETKPRPTVESESKIPRVESPDEKKKREQQGRLAQLKSSLGNSGSSSLAQTLKENPSLKLALDEGDDSQLADELGLEKDDPQIQQLKAQHKVKSDIKKFSDEFKELEKKGYASTDYEKALLAETKKLVERHQPMVDLLATRTGDSPGALAGRLESWDQLINKKNLKKDGAEKVAEEMAGFLRSVGDRGGLEKKIGQAQEEARENRLLGYLNRATFLTNHFPQDPQSRLAIMAQVQKKDSNVDGQFTEKFLSEWPKQVQAMKEFGQLRDAAIKVGPDGRYTVNSVAMAKLKEKFPTLNQEWANAVGDKKSLWGAGFDTAKEEWSFTARQNQLDPSFNLFPPTLRARDSLALQQFLDQKPNGTGATNLSSLANAAAAQNRMQLAQSQLASAQPVMRKVPNGVQNLVQSSLAGLNQVNPRASSLNLDEMFPAETSGKPTEKLDTSNQLPLNKVLRLPEGEANNILHQIAQGNAPVISTQLKALSSVEQTALFNRLQSMKNNGSFMFEDQKNLFEYMKTNRSDNTGNSAKSAGSLRARLPNDGLSGDSLLNKGILASGVSPIGLPASKVQSLRSLNYTKVGDGTFGTAVKGAISRGDFTALQIERFYREASKTAGREGSSYSALADWIRRQYNLNGN